MKVFSCIWWFFCSVAHIGLVKFNIVAVVEQPVWTRRVCGDQGRQVKAIRTCGKKGNFQDAITMFEALRHQCNDLAALKYFHDAMADSVADVVSYNLAIEGQLATGNSRAAQRACCVRCVQLGCPKVSSLTTACSTPKCNKETRAKLDRRVEVCWACSQCGHLLNSLESLRTSMPCTGIVQSYGSHAIDGVTNG